MIVGEENTIVKVVMNNTNGVVGWGADFDAFVEVYDFTVFAENKAYKSMTLSQLASFVVNMVSLNKYVPYELTKLDSSYFNEEIFEIK